MKSPTASPNRFTTFQITCSRATWLRGLFLALMGLAFSSGLEADTITPLDAVTGNEQNGSDPHNFIRMGADVYFLATPTANPDGVSLYKTSGGAPTKIADFTADWVHHVGVAGGSTLYIALQNGTDVELWKSDGTTGGTVLVKNLGTAPEFEILGVIYGSTTPNSQRVFFNYWDSTNGWEIWTSDGTTGGTGMIDDLTPGTGATGIQEGVVMGDILFFAHDGGDGVEPWKTDGTSLGTVQLEDINPNPGGGSSPVNFTLWNGAVYFTASDTGSSDDDVWVTDGTTTNFFSGDGTDDFFAGDIGAMRPIGNTLYLIAFGSSTSSTLYSLWALDTAGTASEVKELPDGLYASDESLWAAGTRLFFNWASDTYANQLWTSNGTTAGTIMVKEIHPGQSGSKLSSTTAAIGNTTYFLAAGWDDFNVVGLYKSDGTAAGTVAVYTHPGDGGALQEGIFTFGEGSSVFGGNGSAIFFAGYDATNGSEPWKVNGAPAALLANLNTDTLPRSGYPWDIRPLGTNSVILQLENATNGIELWKSNGTLAGTTLVKDIRAGARSSYSWLGGGIPLGTKFLFGAHNGVSGYEPWFTDGTPAGTALLKDLVPGIQSGGFYNPVNLGGLIYFQSNGILHKTTGAAGNATEVLLPDTISFIFRTMAVSGSNLYFSAFVDGADPMVDPSLGEELVITNGTTTIVVDINATDYEGSSPGHFTPVGTTMFFGADDGTDGYQLWKSNGTEAGTELVKVINATGDAFDRYSFDNPDNPTWINFGGSLFFAADNGIDGVELWKSNGTGAGTTMVMDINPTGSSSPQQFIIMGSFLYFVADDGTSGFELWRTDGTTTEMVKDVGPGATGIDGGDGLFKRIFAVLNGRLYFAADDGVNGNELWSTDGTNAGTALVADINPGAGSSYPDQLTASGTLLYFGAYNPAIGNELHVLAQGPEIGVNQGVGGTSLTDGSATPVDFGNVPINTNAPITFEIVNTGTSNLTGLVVTKTGAHMANFTVGALGATTLDPGATTTFTVTFNTPDVGTRTAALSIASNDANENPFNINLIASGTTPGGVLAFGGTLFEVREGDDIDIPILRTGGTGTINVTVNTANGSATVAGGDYTAVTSQVVPITAGNNGTINIQTANAGGDEPHETFTVTLSNPTNGSQLAAPKTATIRIIDSADNAAPPAPVISKPLASALVNVAPAGQVMIAGTATDNKGVQAVEYRVTTPGGAPSTFTPATLGSPGAKSTTWSGTITTPVTGNTTFEVRTLDFKSPMPNSSTLASRTFKVLRQLVASVSGSGTLTSGFLGTTFREVGKPHTITATAGSGALFSGWTVLSGHTNTQLGVNATALQKTTLSFIHREGLALQANFVTNPYTTNVVGIFNGAITPSATLPAAGGSGPGGVGTASGLETEGSISNLKVETTGAFSGKIMIDGLTLGVAGTFDHNGSARFGTSRAKTLSVARSNKPSLNVGLNINVGIGQITGLVWHTENGATTAVSDMLADRAVFSATNPVPATAFSATAPRPATGTYTMLFQPGSGGALATEEFPQGFGHGTITVGTTGTVTVAGKLADNTVISMSTTLAQTGTWRLFVQLYTGLQGFLAGNVAINHADGDSDFEAPDTRWVRPILDTQHYPLGWTEGITVDTFGSRYIVTAGQSVLPLNQATGTGNGNADLTFSDAQLAANVVKQVDISPTDTVAEVPVDATYNLTISRTTGGISGSFTHSDGTKPAFSGIIYQKSELGRGFWLTTTPNPKTYTGESGGVLLLKQ